MKKILYFLGSFAVLVGSGCSLGWAIKLKEWGMLVGVIALIIAAVPTVKRWIQKLISE